MTAARKGAFCSFPKLKICLAACRARQFRFVQLRSVECEGCASARSVNLSSAPPSSSPPCNPLARSSSLLFLGRKSFVGSGYALKRAAVAVIDMMCGCLYVITGRAAPFIGKRAFFCLLLRYVMDHVFFFPGGRAVWGSVTHGGLCENGRSWGRIQRWALYLFYLCHCFDINICCNVLALRSWVREDPTRSFCAHPPIHLE